MDKPRSRPTLLVWLRPGVHIKRWLILAGGALILSSLGIGLILADLYRREPFPEFAYYLTLQFIPRLPRGIVILAAGIVLQGLAWYRFSRSLLGAILPGTSGPVIRAAIERRYLQAGPRIVAIGGGTGLSTLLQGLKEITSNSTAIVTVADDGGSSGRLRRDLGILPPGDFRQCLVALADAEPLMARLLQHRFREAGDLGGHSFGNLFLTALTEVTGSFERALEECSRVLAVRGKVLPSTLADVTLCAELADGRIVRGESAIGHAGSPIRRVLLDPADAPAHPAAVQAILGADVVIVGPGSLYTSVLPSLLVGDLAKAVRDTSARKVYVCNVATEPGETTGFGVDDFVRALKEHLGDLGVDCVLANSNLRPAGRRLDLEAEPVELVRMDPDGWARGRLRVLGADVINEANPVRHDPRKLATALAQLVR